VQPACFESLHLLEILEVGFVLEAIGLLRADQGIQIREGHFSVRRRGSRSLLTLQLLDQRFHTAQVQDFARSIADDPRVILSGDVEEVPRHEIDLAAPMDPHLGASREHHPDVLGKTAPGGPGQRDA
jgi:hypothetical protein